MRGPLLGALIGAIGGLVFVLVNAGGLPAAWVTPVRGIGLVAFLAVLSRIISGARRPSPSGPAPSRKAWRVYWTSVGLEVLALPLGANLLARVQQPQLTLPWVVFVVGAHFLPFSRVFAAPVFRALAWTLIGLSLVGAALTLAGWPTAPAATAVLAGFALLGFSLFGGRGRRAP